MIEPRIYRAALVPAVLALVLVMFSLENRPPPLPQGLAADVLFDSRLALGTLRQIVADHPDRRPGTTGDSASAALVRRAFASRGFQTTVDRFEDGGVPMQNVVGRRPGTSRRQIVVLAARDAASVPDARRSAADTAALLELARIYEGRASRKTLVLASVDGATLGDAGARRFVETVQDRGLIEGAVVVSNLGSQRASGPPVVGWSNDASRESIGLRGTAEASLGEEVDRVPVGESPAVQLVRLALPLGLGAQGELLERDVEAIRLSGSGELPPANVPDRLEDVDATRLADFGRAALRTVSAIDAGGTPEHGPPTYLVVGSKVLPGWAISALSIALIFPALVAAVDGFARARRRRQPVSRWWIWVMAGALPFALGLLLAVVAGLTGLAPGVSASPPPPGTFPLDATGAMLLAVIAAAVALAWVLGRSWLLRRDERLTDLASPGAATATALVLTVTVAIVWLLNPFTALLLVPAAHLWMLATLSEAPPRPAVAAALVAGGLVLPVLACVSYLAQLELGPLEGVWYLFLLISSGHVGIAGALAGCVLLAVLRATVAIVVGQRRPPVEVSREEERAVRLRGPGGYAGPGSLGGTGSALRR